MNIWRSLFQKTMDKYSLQIEKASCLRERYRQHGCQRCLKICPAQALKIKEGSIALEPSKCNQCGLCCYLCPTEVFSIGGGLLEKLSQDLDNKEMACFTCQKQGTIGDVVVTCLEALSPEILVPAFLRGIPVQIYWQPQICQGCPFTFQEEKLCHWVAQWNNFGGDRFWVEIIHEPQKKKSSLKNLSRRDFFAFSKNQIREQVHTLLAEPVSQGERLLNKVGLPQKRMYFNILLQRYPQLKKRKLSKDLATYLRLCNLEIQGDCNLCDRCTSLCPTGALQLDLVENSGALLFHGEKCLDCGICTALCDYLKRKPLEVLAGWTTSRCLKKVSYFLAPAAENLDSKKIPFVTGSRAKSPGESLGGFGKGFLAVA